MKTPRQYYTEEFKQEAVKLIRESGLKLMAAMASTRPSEVERVLRRSGNVTISVFSHKNARSPFVTNAFASTFSGTIIVVTPDSDGVVINSITCSYF